MKIPRGPRLSLPILLISTLLISHIAAQGLPQLPDNNDDKNNDKPAANTDKAAETDKAAATTDAAAKTTAKASAKESASASASATDAAGLTGLPKLAQDNYPPPTVPPTADAPFMQKSTLPDGTVFIAVGAFLGFFGFLVLAWRGLVAWSIHRSVKRAAVAQSAKYSQLGDHKQASGKHKSMYFNSGMGSTMSLDQLGAMNKRGSKTHSTQGSLFFSPTAGAGMHTPANRGSGYLPAGYYAAGNATAGGESGVAHIGGGGNRHSNLRPESRRYSKTRSGDPSPPRSPILPPSRGGDAPYSGRLSVGGLGTHASNGSLNISGQSRAPSAYLEDLFENPPGSIAPTEEHTRGRR